MNNQNDNNHDALRDDLKAYLDGELTFLRRAAVRRHLASCAACRTEINEMETVTKQLLAEEGAETAFDANLRARILNDAPVADRTFETVPVHRRKPSVKDFVFVGGIASLLIIATLTQTGKKVQTVFNVSNNALTTDGGGDYQAPAPQAGIVAATKDYFARKSEERENARRSSAEEVSAGAASSVTSPTAPVPSGRVDANYQEQSRRVHKEANIGVAVKSAESASDATVALVQGAGGFIASNSLTTGGDNSKTASMELRVPVGKFERVLAEIGKLGEVKSKNISGQDLTERFSDADQSRRILINDLSLKEAQLRAAKERAAAKRRTYVPGWEERMELRNLRIQAAQARARLELMRKTTDLSNISVQLQESALPPGEAGFWQSLNSTKADAAQSFVNAARIPIACLIWILAYSPLWLPLLFAWRYFSRQPKSTV